MDMFLGDQLKHQNNFIRIVYNNCDGLKIKQFLKMKAGQEKERRNKKAIVNLNESSKVSKCVGMLREYNTNDVCMAETQTAWEFHNIRN